MAGFKANPLGFLFQLQKNRNLPVYHRLVSAQTDFDFKSWVSLTAPEQVQVWGIEVHGENCAVEKLIRLNLVFNSG